jgi:pyrroline-5-carboxylate reductase
LFVGGEMEKLRLAFIGSGTMAEAMIRGILRVGLADPDAIWASGPRGERGKDLAGRYGVHATVDNAEAVRNGDVVVLAVKPQRLQQALGSIAGAVRPDQLIMTIVAGARCHMISHALGNTAVVRVMPNTPAQIGAGVSVWWASEGVTEAQKGTVRELLKALGTEVEVDEERMIDMATAVSGTGPTYVFLVMEALVDAAVHLGFSRRVAQTLVGQTLLGSAMFATQSSLHPAEMRNMVTSPGGTSAEAIYQLEKGGIRTVLSKAVWAAYQKSCVLGETLSNGNSVLADAPTERG